jgi:ribosomal-protein-alanine N-acetyltransferase
VTADLSSLDTERFTLRRLAPTDEEELLAHYADQRVMRHIEPGRPPEKVRAALRRATAQWEAHGHGYWVARPRGGGPIVAAVMLMRDEARGVVELGYLVAPERWGQGTASEVCRRVVEVAFSAVRVPALVARVEAAHGASARVLQKLGFRRTHQAEDGGKLLDWFRLEAPLPDAPGH